MNRKPKIGEIVILKADTRPRPIGRVISKHQRIGRGYAGYGIKITDGYVVNVLRGQILRRAHASEILTYKLLGGE